VGRGHPAAGVDTKKHAHDRSHCRVLHMRPLPPVSNNGRSSVLNGDLLRSENGCSAVWARLVLLKETKN
jgi:hypothetical protein